MSQILEMHEKGMTYEEIAQALGLSYKQVNHAINNARKKQKVQFDDKKDEPTPEDIDRLYAALVNYDQALGATDTKQTKATIRIDDSKPIGIAFWGDWHLIARGMDFQQFDKDKQAISDTDGLFFVGMGDYKDNYKPGMGRASGGMLEQIASPGVQDLLVKKVIEDTAHKCISLIRGCHDDWDKHSADKDFISTLCEIADCVNLWHGGGLNLKLGEQTYKIRARHKYKNESGLNTTNAQRNMLNDFGPCDVIAVGHKHFPDIQTLDRMGQKVTYIRSGTYKVYDEYGQKLAGYQGKWGVPVVVLYPNERRITPFENLYDAIDFLNAIRG